MRCERCGRFLGEDCSEGWTGGLFGDYNGRFYCAIGVGCNRDSKNSTDSLVALRASSGGETP